MSEQSLRAQKNAQTRAHVRATAQRLSQEHGFDAVTIPDVAAALEEALTQDPLTGAGTEPRLTARLVAATWLSVTRSLVVTVRDPLPAPAGVPALVAEVRALTGRLLSRLEADLTDDGADVDEAGPGVLRAV